LTLETGTLILADYTAKIKDTGAIIDTTRKEDAEKAGNADPTRIYEPRLIAIGEGWVLKGLDEALQKADSGQQLVVELTPDKAFGIRDPNRVSRVPIRKFGEKAAELEVGGEVELDNRVGIVRSLESGRAVIDFNHKYAGKILEYNVEIKQKLDSREAKVEALIRRRMPIEKEKLKFELVGEEQVRVSIPNDLFLMEGLQITKRGVSNDLFKFIKPLNNVQFVEEYENPTPSKPVDTTTMPDIVAMATQKKPAEAPTPAESEKPAEAPAEAEKPAGEMKAETSS
jgi:peptidylprolyl isomerase